MRTVKPLLPRVFLFKSAGFLLLEVLFALILLTTTLSLLFHQQWLSCKVARECVERMQGLYHTITLSEKMLYAKSFSELPVHQNDCYVVKYDQLSIPVQLVDPIDSFDLEETAKNALLVTVHVAWKDSAGGQQSVELIGGLKKDV